MKKLTMLVCILLTGFVSAYAQHGNSGSSGGSRGSSGGSFGSPHASVSAPSSVRLGAAPATRSFGSPNRVSQRNYNAGPIRVYDNHRHPYGPRPIRPIYPFYPIFYGGFYGGYGDYYFFNNGFWYWEYPFGSAYAVEQADCKKESLKDSNGVKHEVLVCRQPDESYQVVADADHLTNSAPVPVNSKTIVVTPPAK